MQSTELIAPLAIQTPFAINGDKNIPSQNAQGTDTSSINLGFLPITSEPLPTPEHPEYTGQAPERIDFNGMFYLSTDQRVFLQNGGFITYNANVSTAIGGYPKGAILGYLDNLGNFNFVESEIENNQYNFITNPGYINGTYWSYRNVLKDLSNISQTITSIPPTALTNFDGQWVFSTKLLSSATAQGVYTINLSTYLPNDNFKYAVKVCFVGFRNSGDTNSYVSICPTNTVPTFLEDIGVIPCYGLCNFDGNHAEAGNIEAEVVVGTDRSFYYSISRANLSTGRLAMTAYRRLGTNS